MPTIKGIVKQAKKKPKTLRPIVVARIQTTSLSFLILSSEIKAAPKKPQRRPRKLICRENLLD